ncbi:MAG: hypothetical protein U0270_17095 [Labilithrix sp.]
MPLTAAIVRAAMPRQRRLGSALEEALVDRLETRRDDADALLMKKSVPAIPIASGSIEYCRVSNVT